MNRRYLKFTRRATVVERGAIAVEVKNSKDHLQLHRAARDKDWKEFLITEREYDEEEWDFEVVPENNNDEGPEVA